LAASANLDQHSPPSVGFCPFGIPRPSSVERGATSWTRSLSFDSKSCSVNSGGLSEIDSPFRASPPRDNRERNDDQDQRVSTAWAVLPRNRPVPAQELVDRSRDPESGGRKCGTGRSTRRPNRCLRRGRRSPGPSASARSWTWRRAAQATGRRVTLYRDDRGDVGDPDANGKNRVAVDTNAKVVEREARLSLPISDGGGQQLSCRCFRCDTAHWTQPRRKTL
jgi:hypothetical protein